MVKIPEPLAASAPRYEGRTRAKNRIERLCADRRLRMTAQRRIVARILSTSHDHPNVEELHRRARKIDSQIALSTVYRIVHVMCGIGIVEKLNLGSGRARLEVVPTRHHDHLIDVRSSEVIEFRSDEIERLLPRIANRLGYRILEHRLVLYGVPLDGSMPTLNPKRQPVFVS